MTIHYKVNLSAQFGQARNQGQRGTCTVFAVSDVNRVASGAMADLSPEFLYMSAGMLMPNWKVGEGIFPWAAWTRSVRPASLSRPTTHTRLPIRLLPRTQSLPQAWRCTAAI